MHWLPDTDALYVVIPANAGIQIFNTSWFPAFAGMTATMGFLGLSQHV